MKASRLEKIIELILKHDIETQEELRRLLLQEGYNVTQATVSRDIKALNLQKVQSGTRNRYIYPGDTDKENTKYLRIFMDGYAGMEQASNLVVVKTVSGMAMAVAAALDNMGFSEVVGTIAGDDTIMCATRSASEAERLLKKIRELLAKVQ